MGLQGVLVGSPEGEWSRVVVGDYSPTDFSLSGKSLALLSNLSVWVTAFALSVSMTVTSQVLSRYRRENVRLGFAVTLGIITFGIVFTPSILELSFGLPFLSAVFWPYFLMDGLLVLSTVGSLPLILVAIGLMIYRVLAPKHGKAAQGLALALGVISMIYAGVQLLAFGLSGTESLLNWDVALFLFPIVTALCATSAMVVVPPQPGDWPALRTGCAGIHGLVILVFLMWAQLGFGVTFAKISAFILAALVAIVLTAHLKRRQRQGSG